MAHIAAPGRQYSDLLMVVASRKLQAKTVSTEPRGATHVGLQEAWPWPVTIFDDQSSMEGSPCQGSFYV